LTKRRYIVGGEEDKCFPILAQPIRKKKNTKKWELFFLSLDSFSFWDGSLAKNGLPFQASSLIILPSHSLFDMRETQIKIIKRENIIVSCTE